MKLLEYGKTNIDAHLFTQVCTHMHMHAFKYTLTHTYFLALIPVPGDKSFQLNTVIYVPICNF